jgi:hypothetical protein
VHHMHIMLQGNNLSAAFLNALGSVTQLQLLDGQQMFSMPASFFTGVENLPNLQTLRIGCDAIWGGPNRTLPAVWTTVNISAPIWPSLQTLSITLCRLSGNLTWLNTPGLFPRLKNLELSYNNLAGTLPAGADDLLGLFLCAYCYLMGRRPSHCCTAQR